MDFKQIEAFVNVVRYKSFSKAADASFFSQPTLSAHVRNLEKELGVKLLERSGRTVEPTPQGLEFYKHAVEMINLRARAVDAISPEPEELSGIIEIQTSSVPGVTFLPGLMSEFRNEHGDVQYAVSLSDSENVINNVLDRRGEIGFIGEDVSNAALETHLISKDKSVLIAPLTYKIKNVINPSDVLRYPFIWRETGSATRKNFENTISDAGLSQEDMKLSVVVDDIDAVIRNVEEGLGVSIVSSKVAAMFEGRVKIAKITGFDEARSFYMIRLKDSSLSPAANAFYEFTKAKGLV